jgi:hypothetical protein
MDRKIRNDSYGIIVELIDKGFRMTMNDITEDDFDIFINNRVFWWIDVSDYIITLINYLNRSGYDTKTYKLDGLEVLIHPEEIRGNFLTGQIYIQVKRRS